MTKYDFLKEKYSYIKSNFTEICKKYKEIAIRNYSLIANKYCTRDFFISHKDSILKYGFPLVFILYVMHSCTSSQNDIKRNVQDIFNLSDEIRAHFADKPDYWKLSNKYVIEKRILSDKYYKNNNIILSNKQIIYIGNGTKGDIVLPGSDTFDIAVPNLNKAQCVLYSENILSDTNLMKLTKIRIYNAKNSYTFEWGGDYLLPVQRYATKGLCDKNNNTVVWSLK